MDKKRRKILEQLSEKKISVEEADRLLTEAAEPGTKIKPKRPPRFLKVSIEPVNRAKGGDRVNIQIPLKLLRAGIKWSALLPGDVRIKMDRAMGDRGFEMDFSRLSQEEIDELFMELHDFVVDIEGSDRIKVFCE